MKLDAYHYLAIVLCIGLLFNGYLLYESYMVPEGTPSLCTFGDSFDCVSVSRSPYAYFDGFVYFVNWKLSDAGFGLRFPYPLLPIPNALLLAGVFCAWLVLMYYHKMERQFLGMQPSALYRAVLVSMMFGLLYAVFLLYISVMVLKTYCIVCLGLDVVLVVSFLLVYSIGRKTVVPGVRVH